MFRAVPGLRTFETQPLRVMFSPGTSCPSSAFCFLRRLPRVGRDQRVAVGGLRPFSYHFPGSGLTALWMRRLSGVLFSFSLQDLLTFRAFPPQKLLTSRLLKLLELHCKSLLSRAALLLVFSLRWLKVLSFFVEFPSCTICWRISALFLSEFLPISE